MAWQRSIGSSYCMVYVGLGLGWLALLHMLHRQMFSRALCVVKTRYITNLLMNLKKALQDNEIEIKSKIIFVIPKI